MQIKQLNCQGGGTSQSKLTAVLRMCTKPAINCDCSLLLNGLLKCTAIELTCRKINNAEERRVRWTMYFNLKSWFDNWERDLVELCFASINEVDKIEIPALQLERIISIDETCLTMDGSKCNQGGRA